MGESWAGRQAERRGELQFAEIPILQRPLSHSSLQRPLSSADLGALSESNGDPANSTPTFKEGRFPSARGGWKPPLPGHRRRLLDKALDCIPSPRAMPKGYQ